MDILRFSCSDPRFNGLLTRERGNNYMDLRNGGPSIEDMRKTTTNVLEASKVSRIDAWRHSNCKAMEWIQDVKSGAKQPGEYSPRGLLRSFDGRTFENREDLEMRVNKEVQLEALKRYGIPVEERFFDVVKMGIEKSHDNLTLAILSPTWNLDFNKIAMTMGTKPNGTYFITTDDILESRNQIAFFIENGVKDIRFVAVEDKQNKPLQDCAEWLKSAPFISDAYVGFVSLGGFML